MVKINDKKIRQECLAKTWENLNIKFPNWRKNNILKRRKTGKDLYMKSVNKYTYKFYCVFFRII